MSDLPEPDRIAGAPHPRETTKLLGQAKAEAAFLEAFNTGRMHHGWLITGPRGVGKSTLAWRIARFLIAQPPAGDDSGLFGDAPPAPTSLDISSDHPVSQRIAALSEPQLFLLRRAANDKGDGLKTVITVDEVRRLKSFLSLSATDGGRRVVIVDAADEMNVSAANALLKLLEEPPDDTILLLVSHQPSGLLPTIKSRCRELRCTPLSPDDLATALATAGVEEISDPTVLAALAAGSVGEAMRLVTLGGHQIYQTLCDLFHAAPGLDRPRALAMAESAVGKKNAERYELLLDMFDLFLSRMARAGVSGPPVIEAAKGEIALFAKLAPTPRHGRRWAELQQSLSARVRHGRAVNLDPAALILDMLLKMDQTAAEVAA
ncbi:MULTISPECIES: DNA polymerase III subunit delta' [Halocynthiibacter]|uniref:DNA polymerase III subunit delta n=1 Tax=Halocynthiibacter halioticoli TaxID=2986804 RepID=A0AAE3J3M5_9RHOB|nr:MULTISPECIES: DNA polymerase III subunit delta' [Halocynthiibacter]MCV6824897.1 DNA polymerase III subunit delta' [Halocynthiibacter halioticoli]MCW4057898.1 DNA polymerase III subunit delta' [Halocynthiibacter sp. SDUM655004]